MTMPPNKAWVTKHPPAESRSFTLTWEFDLVSTWRSRRALAPLKRSAEMSQESRKEFLKTKRERYAGRGRDWRNDWGRRGQPRMALSRLFGKPREVVAPQIVKQGEE